MTRITARERGTARGNGTVRVASGTVGGHSAVPYRCHGRTSTDYRVCELADVTVLRRDNFQDERDPDRGWGVSAGGGKDRGGRG